MINKAGHNNSHFYLVNRLGWAFGLTAFIFFAELIGGILSNSLALLSDAGHVFGDMLALGLSLGALLISRKPANAKKTFGYHRAEVIAALINGISLMVIAGLIFHEAYRRLIEPEQVKTLPMLIVAVVGLVVNIVVALRLHRAAENNLNIKSAFLHVVGDMLASVGVIAGGLIMMFTGNYIADPIISVVVGLIILRGAYRVVKEGMNIIFEGVPLRVDYDLIKQDIIQTPGVLGVHDLHIWTLSSSNIILTVHVLLDGKTPHVGREVLEHLQKMLNEKYGINHTTVQLECECYECPSDEECPVNRINGKDNSY